MTTDRAGRRANAGVSAGIAVAMLAWAQVAQAEAPAYAWPATTDAALAARVTLAERIAPPPGFARVPAAPGSFAAWLRGLPMRPAGTPVRLHTGQPKVRQDAHVAVVDIDVGARDLQQCADAIMRLRAEWLYGQGRHGDIAFDWTNGARIPFSRFAAGERPKAAGRSVTWSANARADAGYATFRRYMDDIFRYAGTASLARELKPAAIADMAIGDVFIKGGFPGHAVLVVDMVMRGDTGERRFLLLQSYMPAQDMHVLANPRANDASPWYGIDFGSDLVTPEWTFARDALKRWP